MPGVGVVTLRVDPVSQEDDLGPSADAREATMAAATAIGLILVFIVVAIGAYWMLVYRTS
jgi:hypothetical protein